MPIYEYVCEHCGRLSSFFVCNIRTHRTPACPKCGASEMRRAVSRFAAVASRKGGRSAADETSEASGADSMDSGAPPAPEGPEPDFSEMESMLENMDENDPRAMGRVMRKLAEQSGEPLDEEMDEVVRRLEAGEDPEKIEEKMGGAADEGGGGDEWYDG